MNKRYISILSVFLMLLVGSFSVSAADTKTDVWKKEGKELVKKQSMVTAEAIDAIKYTQKALKNIGKKDKKKALSNLEKATGKLELLLARKPSVSLIPVDVSIHTQDFIAPASKINSMKTSVIQLIVLGKVQKARSLLNSLSSETVISTANIPLSTYPAAIKLAAKQLDNDNYDKASMTLSSALNTLVITNYVIPLPVVRANALLNQANALFEKKERTKEQNKELTNLINESEKQISIAEALGYGTRHDFDGIRSEINSIKEKISGNKSGSGLLEKLKRYLENLINDSQSKESEKS